MAIIGAGPAGIAAAIYLKRAGFEPMVFEKCDVGGLLKNANLVENYPGFPDGIGGKVLVQLFKEQLFRLGVEIKNIEVKNVSSESGYFTLATDEREMISRALIVATGTIPKSMEMEGQSHLFGKKLFYEIKDIPPPSREDTFMVIGGGDTAFDYALNLSGDGARVDIIFRGEIPKCLSLLEERVRKSPNIHIHPKTVPLAVDEAGERITIKCISDEKEIKLTSDYALIAVGRSPNLELLPKESRKTLTIKENGGTNIPGLFLAGDVRRGLFRQTGIAVGDGILCAMSALNFLRGDDEK
ncbi:MAG: NAD(P)/FAD-dependent oxidoreductase [Thermoplasmata archaeon]